MTLVAALSLHGCPTLIGDVVASYNERRLDNVGKIYRIARNVAVGWSRQS
jgi:hypothetical protein